MRALPSKAEYQTSQPRIFHSRDNPEGPGSTYHFSPQPSSPGSHPEAKPFRTALIVLLLESASLLHNQNLLAQRAPAPQWEKTLKVEARLWAGRQESLAPVATGSSPR